jgi:hypothetical protein
MEGFGEGNSEQLWVLSSRGLKYRMEESVNPPGSRGQGHDG